MDVVTIAVSIVGGGVSGAVSTFLYRKPRQLSRFTAPSPGHVHVADSMFNDGIKGWRCQCGEPMNV